MRERHSPEKLAELYAEPHDHTKWDDHLLRVDATISVAHWMIRDVSKPIVADLSCGNATIAKALVDSEEQLILGDFAPGLQYHGPIEQTIHDIDRKIDLFICSETIEHLDDPWMVLRDIRKKADRLVLSTPIDEKLADENEEHYWAWDVEGVADMLHTTGWSPVTRTDLTFMDWFFPYNFQIWGCK